jgi:hypothetical protein
VAVQHYIPPMSMATPSNLEASCVLVGHEQCAQEIPKKDSSSEQRLGTADATVTTEVSYSRRDFKNILDVALLKTCSSSLIHLMSQHIDQVLHHPLPMIGRFTGLERNFGLMEETS